MQRLVRSLVERLNRRRAELAGVPQPKLPAQALLRDGNEALAAGRTAEAAEQFRQAVALDPDTAINHLNLGFALLELNLAVQAAPVLERAAALDPLLADAHYLLGRARQEQGNWGAAHESYRKAVECKPDFDHAWRDLGAVCERSGDPAAALECYERAALLRPESVEATSGCARLCAQLGRHGDALRWSQLWSDAAPDDWQPQLLRGQVLAATGQYSAGMEALAKAMAGSNGHPLVWHARGNALFGADRIEEAAAAYEKALTSMPDFIEAQVNCGVCWHRLGEPAKALRYLDAALARRRDHAQALYNRTLALIDLRRLDDAMASAAEARARQPDDANIQWNYAVAHLTAGQWREGWPALESRWRATALGTTVTPHQFTQPRWTGEALQGKTILVYAEQGLGDTLQFVRFVPLLEQRGAQVLLWVPQALQELLASVSPNCRVATHIQQLPPFDYECPLMSLPGAFRTSLDDVPSQVPYLRADAARRLEWESLLGPRTGLRVGLAWSGSGAHRNHRSVPLPMLGGLLALGCDFVSVQKELSDADLADLKRQGKVRHFGERLNSMADTAALLECMDLVVSVDTSIAHLAGALARPLCVMLPFRSDWRWLQGRDDSPWYPSARLFRQATAHHWEDVVAAVEATVARVLAGGVAAWPDVSPKVRAETTAAPDGVHQAQEWLAEGNRMEDAGDLAGALERYRQAAQAAPKYPEAQLNLGIGLAAAGDAAGAARAYEELLALDANHPFGNYNYANLAYQDGDLGKAEGLLRRALASRPDFPQAHVQLANVLDDRGDAAGAEQSFRAALALKPAYPGAHYNLAMLLLRQQRPAEALAAAEQAAMLDPESVAAQALLARLLIDNGLGLEALVPLRKAIALAPGNMELRSRELFLMNLDESVRADALFKHHLAAGALLEQSVPARFAGAWKQGKDPRKRLRVGFVSSDFRVHPVSLFLLPVLERRDRTQFEVVCYSRVEAQDHITERIRGLADRWVDASSMTNPELAAAIHADGVDVLVDLLGHTGNYALPAYCEQPAPVQVGWMGYLNTTGLTRIQYRLCDSRGDPPELSAHLHTEELVALPESQWCYRPFFETPLQEEAPYVRNGVITFGSFNAESKVTAAMCGRWARIVKKVPGSRLLIAGVTSPAKEHAMLASLQREGLGPDRVTVAQRVTLDKYLELIATVDIALDSFPYGGGTTTFDALYMGVPVLTATGDTPASRSAASILSGLGLDDWIAGSIDGYEQLAVDRAADRDAIARLRTSLRVRLQGSGFMAEERYVRYFEAALRGLWRRYCEDAAPAGAGRVKDPASA